MCWRVQTAALWVESDSRRGNTFSPLVTEISFLENKRLLLLSSCTSYQKAYRLSPFLLSTPSAIYLLIRYQLGGHLPQASWSYSILISYVTSARVLIQHETRLKHIFPRPAPFYFSLANNVSLRKGELSFRSQTPHGAGGLQALRGDEQVLVSPRSIKLMVYFVNFWYSIRTSGPIDTAHVQLSEMSRKYDVSLVIYLHRQSREKQCYNSECYWLWTF